MRRQTVRGAVVAAGFAAALAVMAAGAAGAADCWLLDSPALERARADGLCQDVFARNAPTVKPAPSAKPARSRPAKASRRASAKAKGQPSLAAALERLVNQLKPEPGMPGRRRDGGIDHLSYGSTSPNPVQR